MHYGKPDSCQESLNCQRDFQMHLIFLKYKKIINIPNKIILLNSGLIIAGVPFSQIQQFNYIFWIIGGVLAASGIGWYFYDKIKKK